MLPDLLLQRHASTALGTPLALVASKDVVRAYIDMPLEWCWGVAACGPLSPKRRAAASSWNARQACACLL
jgi:hypothetical protein